MKPFLYPSPTKNLLKTFVFHDSRILAQLAPKSCLWHNAGGRLPANRSAVPPCFIVCDVSLHSSRSRRRSPWQLEGRCAGDITVLFLRLTHRARSQILLFLMFTLHFNPGEDHWTKPCAFHALLSWLGALYSSFLPVLPRIRERITLLVHGDQKLPMGSWEKTISKPANALSLKGAGLSVSLQTQCNCI